MKKAILWMFVILTVMQLVTALTVTRDVAQSVGPNQDFIVTYSVTGVSGKWGVVIEDIVHGGCSFPAGTKYGGVLLSDEGTTKQVTVRAANAGSCQFDGNYMYDETTGEIAFPTKTVNIASACVISTEICDGVDNDCDSQIDENNVCDCKENWNCDEWSSCVNNQQARDCTDINKCGTTFQKPLVLQSCTAGNGGTGGDLCKYMEWAKSISENNYCVIGLGIIGGGLVLLLLLMRK